MSIPRVSPEDALARETLMRLRVNSAVSGLVVPFYFKEQGPLQPLVHQLKYGGVTILGEELGIHLGLLMQHRSIGGGDALLVPVPLHRAKRRERGYNQAECICRGAARVTGLRVRPDIVSRRKYTATQTHLKLEERRANVRNAFALVPAGRSLIRGKVVCLVDDVITTGSTIGECGTLLQDAGASTVIACAVGLAEHR